MSDINEKFGKEYFMENNMIKDIKKDNSFQNDYLEKINKYNYIDESSDIKNQKYNENYEKERKSLINESIDKPTAGIMLSYGEGKDIVPAGSYTMSRIVSGIGNPTISDSQDGSNLFVEFVEIEKTEDNRVVRKEPGNKIYVPYEVYISKGFSIKREFNMGAIGNLTGGYVGRSEVTAVNDRMSESLRDKEPGTTVTGVDLAGMTLTDANAVLVSPTGERRATNYTIFPVSYGMIKMLEKILIKTKEPVEKNKEMLMNVRYAPTDFEYNNKKGENWEMPDREAEPGSIEMPPRIIEPSPAKTPEIGKPIPEGPPMIFYEQEEQERGMKR